MLRSLVVGTVGFVIAASCAAGDEVTPMAEPTTTSLTPVATAEVPTTASSTPPETTTTMPTAATTTLGETTTTTLVPIGDVESGLFCRTLVSAGYDYSDAVLYWEREGSPDRMDADLNGIPCQTVYPHSTVVQYWGEPLPVTMSNQFAFIVSVDPGPPISIVADYADWLWGDEAEKACRQDGKGPDCAYEGLYYIRNVNPRLRTLAVADNAKVFSAYSAHLAESGIACVPASESEMRDEGFDDHPTDGCTVPVTALPLLWPWLDASDPCEWCLAWLIVDSGVVTAIQEQYTP